MKKKNNSKWIVVLFTVMLVLLTLAQSLFAVHKWGLN